MNSHTTMDHAAMAPAATAAEMAKDPICGMMVKKAGALAAGGLVSVELMPKDAPAGQSIFSVCWLHDTALGVRPWTWRSDQ